MLHFLHCFQIVSSTEALKGACVEERVKIINSFAAKFKIVVCDMFRILYFYEINNRNN